MVLLGVLLVAPIRTPTLVFTTGTVSVMTTSTSFASAISTIMSTATSSTVVERPVVSFPIGRFRKRLLGVFQLVLFLIREHCEVGTVIVGQPRNRTLNVGNLEPNRDSHQGVWIKVWSISFNAGTHVLT
jgi:hypothetical protein